MTREETLKWFKEIAIPRIQENRGMFSTYYYVFEDNDGYGDYDPYYFKIEYQPYSCSVDTEDGCNDCPYRTFHNNCGEDYLYIKEDGTIYYEGTDKIYNEKEFDELLSWFR
jgi:hypothetical protein